MNKLTIGIVAAAMVGLAGGLAFEITANQNAANRIKELQAELSDKTKLELAQSQRQCAAQAENVFHQLGYKTNDPNSTDIALLQNHWNVKLSKCFMTIEFNSFKGATQVKQRFLLDAYEQREFGDYFWLSSPTKKYWEQPPWECKLTPSTETGRGCKSEDEYNAFVAEYME